MSLKHGEHSAVAF